MKRISPAAVKKMRIKLKRAKSCIKFRCPYCGNLTEMFPGCKIDTGTDADFDKYAVQVQNGECYYDAAGNYQSYYKNMDEY